ncbi:hypothetical protein CTI12_AA452310 [Artemisia annua]|uniref:Uncharacterized protein n=1 Tax=Artemisia annua TaxID=35608 RepID=A0A2U1LUH4_ARTAN|nr:hypothetical protein CTI12_AA452310 [Artemisia annua]
MAQKTYVRQNSHNRSISLPCGPDGMEAEYKKLMGQDDEPSSPTSEIAEEDIIDQPPPPRRGRFLVVTSLLLIFIAFMMSRYSKDGFWLTMKRRMFMYQ